MVKFLLLSLVFGGFTLAMSTHAMAADKTHEGIIVNAAEGKLTMTDKEGKNEHSHKIGSAAKVTLEGKEVRLSDLKAGDKVRVTTTEQGDVTAVAASRIVK